MNPTNSQDPVIEPALSDGQNSASQIDAQALQSAKNIIEPEQLNAEPPKPFTADAVSNQNQVLSLQNGQVNGSLTPEINPLQSAQAFAAPTLGQNTQQPIQPNQFNQSVPTSQPQAAIVQPTVLNPQNHLPLNQNVQPQTILTGSVNAPAVSSQFSPNFAQPKPPAKKKYLIGGFVGMFVLLAGAFGFAFLVYIPNLPQNVWKTGFSRTGKQVDAVVKKINEPASVKTIEKTKITLKGSLQYGNTDYSIDVDSKYDKTYSNSTANVKASSKDGKNNLNIDAEIITKIIENATYPNIYFKISGFSAVGLDSFVPGINKYDGKWIAAEQDYFKQLEGTTASKEKTQDNVTEQDVLSIMNDANSVTQQYVFTNDQSKAIVDKLGFVATEKSEGITANHYKAKLNSTNVKAYCVAMVDKMAANESVKKLSKQSDTEFAKSIKTAKDQCDKTDVPDQQFDLWIDKNYKLIHKIRVYEDFEKKNKEVAQKKAKCITDFGKYNSSYCDSYEKQIETGERYEEVGQIYKGKDQFVLFFGGVSSTNTDKSKLRTELSVNAKTLNLGGSVKASSNNADNNYNLDLSINTEPYKGDITSDKPSGAIPLQQVIDSLNMGNQF